MTSFFHAFPWLWEPCNQHQGARPQKGYIEEHWSIVQSSLAPTEFFLAAFGIKGMYTSEECS